MFNKKKGTVKLSRPDTPENRKQFILVANIVDGLYDMGSVVDIIDKENGDIWLVNKKLNYVIIVDNTCNTSEKKYDELFINK